MSTPREIRKARKAGRAAFQIEIGEHFEYFDDEDCPAACGATRCPDHLNCARFRRYEIGNWTMCSDFALDQKPGQPCVYQIPLDEGRA
jgi:hypothetical protein